jgi:hypothetical protein
MTCLRRSVLGLAAAALLGGQPVLAQDAADALRLETDADVPVETVAPPPPPLSRITLGDDEVPPLRRRPSTADPYAAQGLRQGAFLLFPSLEMGSVITTNVRRAPTGAKADTGLRLRPSLRVESDWVRHSLVNTVSLEGQQFLRDGDIYSLTGNINGSLRLDLAQGWQGDIDWSYAATSTGLDSSELPATADGARLDHAMALNGAVTQDFGPVAGRLRLGLARNTFGDVELNGGGSQDNGDRDFTTLSVAARASLSTGGKLQPFAELAYEPRIYDRTRDRNGLKRSSQGLRLTTGLTLADEPLWSGEVAASLEMRDYSDGRLGSVLAPGVVASVSWRPTDLTRFEFNAGVSLEETIAAGVAAQKNWTAGVRAIHALRDNVELSAGLRTALEKTSADSNVTTTASLGLNWTLNPMVVLNAGYEGTFFSGSAGGSDYTDHRILTGIILRR